MDLTSNFESGGATPSLLLSGVPISSENPKPRALPSPPSLSPSPRSYRFSFSTVDCRLISRSAKGGNRHFSRDNHLTLPLFPLFTPRCSKEKAKDDENLKKEKTTEIIHWLRSEIR